jgi:hypothetical protein
VISVSVTNGRGGVGSTRWRLDFDTCLLQADFALGMDGGKGCVKIMFVGGDGVWGRRRDCLVGVGG